MTGYGALAIGAGLENPTHPDHRSARNLLKKAAGSGSKRFGYLNATGHDVTASGLRAVEAQVTALRNLGVDGALIDRGGAEFGLDSRCRRQIVDAAHDAGLSVLINAGDPQEVLPNLPLDERDGYLFEGFGLGASKTPDAVSHVSKCRAARQARRDLGLRLYGVATYDASTRTAPDATAVDALWQAARDEGLDYFLVTEDRYGASGPRAGQVTDLRPRPAGQNAANE